MSKVLITGDYKAIASESPRYGWIAVFHDGDFRKRVSKYPWTTCVRVRLANWKRWQSAPYIAGAPVKDGLQLHTFNHYKFIYEWFESEERATRVVKAALAKTTDCHYDYMDSPLNNDFKGKPYYAEVSIARAQIVYGERVGIDSLKSIKDTRLHLPSNKMEVALRKMLGRGNELSDEDNEWMNAPMGVPK